MIPDFVENGLLPEGIHQTTMDEFKNRFVVFDGTDRRFRVFEQLETLLNDARQSGIVKRVIIAGSFVTDTPEPNDFDCILVLDPSIVGKELPPVQYNLVSSTSARRTYGGDVMPALEGSAAFTEYMEFFGTTRDGERVGVVEIRL